MIKVTKSKRVIKEQITIDPYIPIDVKWGNWNEAKESTRYCRFGDFKKSLLEVGVGSISGQVRSITLIEASDICLNSSNNCCEILECEKGVPVFSSNGWTGTKRLDIESRLRVTTFKDKIELSFGNGAVVNCIQSGRVIFKMNKLNELCAITICDLAIDEMKELNDSLKYML